jgi:hypothetical protein
VIAVQRQRKFQVTGLAPAQGKEVNALVRAFDLGVQGMFVPEEHVITATLSGDVTEAQLARQPEAIRRAYVEAGWVDVRVEVID